MLKPLIAAAAFCLASGAAAHPHIFVQAGVTLVFDDTGAMTGVRLDWTYDDFFGFLLTTDLGIDPDGDLILTQEEAAILEDAVLAWPEDFGGDLTVRQAESTLPLGPRTEAAAELRDGLVREAHFRPLVTPADPAEPITVQVYDPYFYVAYEIAGEVMLEGGEGCHVSIARPDLDAVSGFVSNLLGGRDAGEVGVDEEFPAVGHLYSDTITVSCNG